MTTKQFIHMICFTVTFSSVLTLLFRIFLENIYINENMIIFSCVWISLLCGGLIIKYLITE
jgi:hypothetical protein